MFGGSEPSLGSPREGSTATGCHIINSPDDIARQIAALKMPSGCARPGAIGNHGTVAIAGTYAGPGGGRSTASGLSTRDDGLTDRRQDRTSFRGLLRGREDVFPRRWENPDSGKSGYSPVCRNEWVRGVCGKPKVKCGECPNQGFVPFNDDALRSHLTGRAPGKFGRFHRRRLSNAAGRDVLVPCRRFRQEVLDAGRCSVP